MISAADQAEWDAILGPYPVLPYENEAHFQVLLAAAIERFDPEDFIGYIEARDYAETVWEQLRLRGYSNNRLKAGAESALAQLISPGGFPGDGSSIARDYWGDNPKWKATAEKKVAKRGINDAAIFAKSLLMNLDETEVFDALRQRREHYRAKLLKERDRREIQRAKIDIPRRGKRTEQPAARQLVS